MRKLIISIGVAGLLGGCAVESYIPPAPIDTPAPASPQATITRSRTINKPVDVVWQSLLKNAHQNGFAVKGSNRAKGTLSVWLPAFEPSQYVTCGTVRVQDGSFTTYTRLLAYVAEHTDTNLEVRADVALRALANDRTEVSVMANYTLRVSFSETAAGAKVGGQVYQFNSQGADSISVSMPRLAAPVQGVCEPTGAAEQSILRAASR